LSRWGHEQEIKQIFPASGTPVQEHPGEYPSFWAAIESIAPKIGCLPQTLSDWVKRYEVDSGQREGFNSS
jgi:hypothetical protein